MRKGENTPLAIIFSYMYFWILHEYKCILSVFILQIDYARNKFIFNLNVFYGVFFYMLGKRTVISFCQAMDSQIPFRDMFDFTHARAHAHTHAHTQHKHAHVLMQE